MNRKMWFIFGVVVVLNATAFYTLSMRELAAPELIVSDLEKKSSDQGIDADRVVPIKNEKMSTDQAIETARKELATRLQVDPQAIQIQRRTVVSNPQNFLDPLELHYFCTVSDLRPFVIDLNRPSFQSPGGSFSVKDNKTLVLEAKKDMPVWVVFPIQISKEQDVSIADGQNPLIQFDYRFGGSDGLLSVFWDNQLVFKADQRLSGNYNEWTNGFPIGPDTSEGPHQLSFRLDAFSSQLSSVGITRLVWEKRVILQSPCLSPETEVVDVTFTYAGSDYRYLVNDEGGFVRR